MDTTGEAGRTASEKRQVVKKSLLKVLAMLFSHLHKTVGNELLVSEFGSGILDQRHDTFVINENLTLGGGAHYLAGTVLRDFDSEILAPAGIAVKMSALQRRHHLKLKHQNL